MHSSDYPNTKSWLSLLKVFAFVFHISDSYLDWGPAHHFMLLSTDNTEVLVMTVLPALTHSCVICKDSRFYHILSFGKAFPN